MATSGKFLFVEIASLMFFVSDEVVILLMEEILHHLSLVVSDGFHTQFYGDSKPLVNLIRILINQHGTIKMLVGGFKHFLFSSLLGEDESNLKSVCFRWVGSTTNQNVTQKMGHFLLTYSSTFWMRHDNQELNVTTKASTASLPVLSRKTLQDDVELLRKTCEHTGFFYLVPWSRPFLGGIGSMGFFGIFTYI